MYTFFLTVHGIISQFLFALGRSDSLLTGFFFGNDNVAIAMLGLEAAWLLGNSRRIIDQSSCSNGMTAILDQLHATLRRKTYEASGK